MPSPDAAAWVRHTVESDLPDVARLWNDGAVMALVGFPDGLGVDDAGMAAWWRAHRANPLTRHFTIGHADLGYCGEAHYRAYPDRPVAEVDIKLLPHARGRGLAALGLGAALDELFARGLAERAAVDPHRDNTAALRLYERLGFRPAPWPEGRGDADHVYLEIDAGTWRRPDC